MNAQYYEQRMMTLRAYLQNDKLRDGERQTLQELLCKVERDLEEADAKEAVCASCRGGGCALCGYTGWVI